MVATDAHRAFVESKDSVMLIIPNLTVQICFSLRTSSLNPMALAGVEQPQLSQPVFTGEVLQQSDHLCGPPLDPLQQVRALLMLRLQSWTQDSRPGLTRAEQRGRIISLDPLAMLLLMQPRIWLFFTQNFKSLSIGVSRSSSVHFKHFGYGS